MGASSGFWCSAITRFHACRRSVESDLSWSVRCKRAAALCRTDETYEDRDFMAHLVPRIYSATCGPPIGPSSTRASSRPLRLMVNRPTRTLAKVQWPARQWPPRVKTVVRRPYDFTLLGSLRSVRAARHRRAWPREESRCPDSAATSSCGRCETGRRSATSQPPCPAAAARAVAPALREFLIPSARVWPTGRPVDHARSSNGFDAVRRLIRWRDNLAVFLVVAVTTVALLVLVATFVVTVLSAAVLTTILSARTVR